MLIISTVFVSLTETNRNAITLLEDLSVYDYTDN